MAFLLPFVLNSNGAEHKNPEADRLAHQLAEIMGESLTEAVTVALRDRLSSVKRQTEPTVLLSEISRIQEFVASLPDRDTRRAEEILGYDQFGLPE